jgi:hypothetical protein
MYTEIVVPDEPGLSCALDCDFIHSMTARAEPIS